MKDYPEPRLPGPEAGPLPDPEARLFPDEIVRLTPDELKIADEVGRARAARARRRQGYAPRFSGQNLERNNLLGARAELAAARYFGLDDVPTVDYREHDLSIGWQVRSSSNPRGRLTLWIEDGRHALEVFVHVVPTATFSEAVVEYRVTGWLYGADVMREEYRDELGRHPSWSAPQRDLAPPASLLEYLVDEAYRAVRDPRPGDIADA